VHSVRVWSSVHEPSARQQAPWHGLGEQESTSSSQVPVQASSVVTVQPPLPSQQAAVPAGGV
jgi:hypothetical protein